MIEPATVHLIAALVGALAMLTLALAVFLPQSAAARAQSNSEFTNGKTFSSLAARIPVSEIRDDLIVRRDGSFCAGCKRSGIATQVAHAERLEAVSSSLDALIKGIGKPVT